MTKAEIARGLADWADKMAGAKQFNDYIAKREKQRASAIRSGDALPASIKGATRGSQGHPRT